MLSSLDFHHTIQDWRYWVDLFALWAFEKKAKAFTSLRLHRRDGISQKKKKNVRKPRSHMKPREYEGYIQGPETCDFLEQF